LRPCKLPGAELVEQFAQADLRNGMTEAILPGADLSRGAGAGINFFRCGLSMKTLGSANFAM